jgi:hypothetical protein
MPKYRDRVGERFGKLLVLRDAGRKFGGVLWECECDCGKVVLVRASSLVCGDSVTCGANGPCHHKWGGGSNNAGSKAWASKKLASMKAKSVDRGYKATEDTPERVIELWEECRGCCCICEKHESECGYLCLDHCHETGLLRGFICNNCNAAIGMFNDSGDLLAKAANYLRIAHGKVRAS